MKVRAAAALCSAATVLLSLAVSAAHATVPEPTTPVTANSTYFDGLGSPYGGCGLPQSELESQDFVALNVYDTPGDYSFYPRPVTDPSKVGIWNNGLNCGRWVQVTVGDRCTGVNDGAPGQPFCRGGSWVSDGYNGATLTMLVADSCGDANAWCRDDPYHLDLAKASLNRFAIDGTPVGDLYPNNYNNRRMAWRFVPAPNYTGDIRIGFLAGAQRWWPAISVSRLPNGIHGVEYFADGAWRPAAMNSDMGQSYVIGGTTSGGTDFRIRIRDASDQPLNGGRVYAFTLPASCANQCGPAYTEVSYTTEGSGPSPSPSPPAGPSPSASPSPTSSPQQLASCTATYTIRSSWPGAHQAEITVTNTGTVPIGGWTVTFTFPGPQQISSVWNSIVTQSGQRVTVSNAGHNGALTPGTSVTVGMIVNGPPQPPTDVTCTPR